MESIWREDREAFQKQTASKLVETFFLNLQNNHSRNNDIITYREPQHDLAKDIMKAIRDNEILLMQAGVGIGKTFGYLIPIFYTYSNVNEFNKVIISTSSIALQEQLLNDIAKVSEMLGIEIKYGIAKGINNYACLKKIEDAIYGFRTNPETKEILKQLRIEISRTHSSDKADLIKLSEEIWDRIKLRNRGNCSNCSYSKRCPYYSRQEMLQSCNIIVTNHANMIYNQANNTELVQDVNFVVYDEAHKLAENIRSINEKELTLDGIKELINTISTILSCHYVDNKVNFSWNDKNYNLRNNGILFENLDKLFSSIMRSATRNFFETQKKIGNEGAYSVTDGGRIGFWITYKVGLQLDMVLSELNKLFVEIRTYEKRYQTKLDNKLIDELRKIYQIFQDMKKGEQSDNIYWATYYKKNRISIKYSPKDISMISKEMFSKDIPNLLLSGTMDASNNYAIPYNELCLDGLINRNIRRAKEYKSPYNYEDNALFYYDTSMPVPSKNEEYIKRLALEVGELIRTTNGKALILFTSKMTMNAVYEILKNEELPFELLLQTDSNTAEVKEYFINNIDSCLFATGAFWEGIDIKGTSLSNVIITQLPFETYDAVNQYLSKNYVDKNSTIHIPKMVMKLTQGIGRLIRSDNDTGVVCCLDSRITGYLTEIQKSIPFPMTKDKKELYRFVDEKILGLTDNYTKTLE